MMISMLQYRLSSYTLDIKNFKDYGLKIRKNNKAIFVVAYYACEDASMMNFKLLTIIQITILKNLI